MTDRINISKKDYNYLLKCKKIVESEFSEKYSKKFLREVKKSEEDYKNGRFISVSNAAERKKIFDSL